MSLGWRDDTRVYDRINDRILKVVDCELVGDPVFDKSTRRKKSSTSAVFLIGEFVAILSLVILAVRLARRRSS